MALSEAPDIDRIALAEVRRLREAQRGNAMAVQALLQPYLPGIWTIAVRFHRDRQAAVEATVAIRDAFRTQLRAFTVEEAFGVQLYRLVWTKLIAGHELKPSQTLPTVRIEHDERPCRPLDEPTWTEVAHRVGPYCRLVYLFGVVTDLPASRLAALTQQPEQHIRDARRAVTASLLEASR